VHRQIWPDIASRTSAAVGSGLRSSSQRAVIIIPGVQNPHWSPWHAAKPSCTGSRALPRARPSTVVTRLPSVIAASTVQDFTGISSSHTTQAPQLEVSQPQCEPVRPSSSRRKWMSSSRGSIVAEYSVPLTVRVSFMTPAPGRGRRRRAAPWW
jgi:hypothetical protein